MDYQEELLSDILDELQPLLKDHYEEIAIYKDHIDLNPNYDLYLLMEQQGALHILTVRDQGTLVGYCVTFVNAHPHYQDHIYAVNDIVYLHPEYRHTEVAPELFNRLQTIMEDRGVSVMTFHMKTYKAFESLMDSLNYDKIEYLFSKYIKKD